MDWIKLVHLTWRQLLDNVGASKHRNPKEKL
eukprot:UN07371